MMTTSKAQEALDRAKKVDPGNPFVASCERFFKAKGFLSERQITSLNRVTPTRRRGAPDAQYHRVNWKSDFYSIDDYGLSNSWDWAGGD